MKFKSSFLILAALAASGVAMATGNVTPTPTYAPSNSSASGTGSAQSNSSASGTGGNSYSDGGQGGAGGNSYSAGGQGGTGGNSYSAGGNAAGGQGGNAQGGQAAAGDSNASSYSGPSYAASGGVSDNSSSKYLSLSFPQPVWTQVPAAFGCIVSNSQATAFGWNFASHSNSKQGSDAVCTTIRMAEAATLHCQFLIASHLNKRVFEQMYPGQSGEFFMTGDLKNLNPMECEDLKRPKLRMDKTANIPAPTPAPVLATEPVACKAQVKAKPRFKVRKAKPCATCCNK